MKLRSSLKLLIMFIFVSVCMFLNNNAKALSQAEAGQYLAEFAINFFDNYADQTFYSSHSYQRGPAYKGQMTSGTSSEGVRYTDKYAFDCVGWISFAVHQSLGIGNESFTFFGVPYHGNSGAGFQGGFTHIYGVGGSGRKIPLDELRQILKPGDLLLSTSQHILLYVGNDEIIHCTGHGPGAAYGGDKGYGIKKEKLSDYYNGFEAVGRIVEDTAFKIDSSNATTIFQGSGGITNSWSDGQGSVTSSSGYETSRIVDANDKLPLYKHMLLTEKYNFNSIIWNRYGHGDLSYCTLKEDLTLGLKYPEDSSGATLDNFMDFTLPYLQTWLIPLSMYSGAITSSNENTTSNDTQFSYMVLKEAMSEIIVNKYEIETCLLTTKYRNYTVQKQVWIEGDDENPGYWEDSGTPWEVNERLEIPTDLSSAVVPLKEDLVGQKIDIESSYHIQQAYTFDLKLINTFKYIKYREEDVSNRINSKSVEVSVGEAISEISYGGTELKQYGMPSHSGTRYKLNGNVYYVNRLWADEFEQTDAKVVPYSYNDVKLYNNQYLGSNSNLQGIPSDWLYDEFLEAIPEGSTSGTRLEDIRWLFPYAIAAAKSVNGQILPSVLVAQAIGEGGWTNINAARTLLLDSSADVSLAGYGSLFGQSYIYGYRGKFPTIKETGTLKQIEAYANNLTSGTYEGYNNAVIISTTPVSSNTQSEYEERAKSAIQALGQTYCGYDTTASNKYVSRIFEHVQAYDLWNLDKIYDELESNGGIDLESARIISSDNDSSSSGNGEASQNINTNITTTNTESNVNEFTLDDSEYYQMYESDSSLNSVDLMNSKPSNYFTYLLKGEQYSNHVGYSRTYLVYSYSELRDKLDEYFETGVLPYFYGSSLGYDVYTKSNYITKAQIVKVGDGIYNSEIPNRLVNSNENGNPSNPPDNSTAKKNSEEGYRGTFTSSTGITYKEYKQDLDPWKDKPYSQDTIGKSGCGPTSVAIIADAYGLNLNVQDVANYMVGNTGATKLKDAVNNLLGLDCTIHYSNYAEALKTNLLAGRPVIVSVGNKPTKMFTGGSHIMAALDINENNEIWISNPNTRTANGWIDLDTFIKYIDRYIITIDEDIRLN